MIRLHDLLTISRLRLSLHAYEMGRHAWMRRTHILRTREEIDQLDGGELVLADGRLRQVLAEDNSVVSALAFRGAAALGYSTAGDSVIPQDLVKVCRRRHLPLIEIPHPISCEDVAKTAVDLIRSPEDLDLTHLLERERTFTTPLATPHAGIRSILDSLCRDYGLRMWLLTSGAVCTSSFQQQPSDADVQNVIDAAISHRGVFDVTLSGNTRACVLPLTMPVRRIRIVSHLVCEVPAEGLSAQAGLALERGASFLKAGLGVVRALRAARRLAEEEFMGRIESGHATSDELGAWARALGAEPRGHLTCILVRGTAATEGDTEEIAHALRDVADSLGASHIVVTRDQEVRAFILRENADRAIEHCLARARILLSARLARLGATMGTSSVIARDTGDFTRVLLDARQVCIFNALRERNPATAHKENQSLSALLLADSASVRSTLHEGVLAPIVTYDRTHGTDLVHTLDVFLSTCGQWSLSAARLGIHVNTLRYRLARIEELTRRSVTSMADRVDFYLALHAGNPADVGNLPC